MRVPSELYRLSFILPDGLYHTVPRGRVTPCQHGTAMNVLGAGLVSVEGRPLEAVLEQARRFMRRHRLGSIGAMLAVDGAASEAGTLSAGAELARFTPALQLALPGIGHAAA
jgi:hypothetical protein